MLPGKERLGSPTGGGMAVGQAVGAFELFTGEAPDAARMDAHFRRLVSTR